MNSIAVRLRLVTSIVPRYSAYVSRSSSFPALSRFAANGRNTMLINHTKFSRSTLGLYDCTCSNTWWCSVQNREITQNVTTNAMIAGQCSASSEPTLSPSRSSPARSTSGSTSRVMAMATVASEKFTRRSRPRSVRAGALMIASLGN